MTAEEEVPMAGPDGGRGTAEVVLDPDAGQLCYTLTYSGIGRPTAAHIHHGVKGKAGPVAVDFDYAKNGDQGCVPVDAAELAEIGAKPADHYVNVHTASYPNGAIRGQLGPA
jgi:CHRD domain-containing protein